ncbi:MAG TPA: acetyl-CoA carboxylase biotin carboxylase subunit, partial [Gemmatimonadales bacterium]|nr:acetyl-CoA carboxylase biotin carboxylase subunit [Gemmatimonadales bacterium]
IRRLTDRSTRRGGTSRVRRVLIANRGEIALRIIRACHEEGLEAVAVYSEVDGGNPHVRAADHAVEIGPAPATESYLNIERLIRAARDTGADAVHPGYGFLAERAVFARAVEDAGLIFIGPPAGAIEAMGEKTEARRRMADAGVPIVPGTTAPTPDVEQALDAARRVGYPVMLKAAAGGGGKGMRRADDPASLRAAFRQAASEARSAFGDGALYVERLLERPRHVEIQVLADQHGTTTHFGERECSVQRRHQKLIEEAPSPAVDAELRSRMGEAAVRAAQSVGYVNAGTVEFLLAPDGQFYFLEMNTRIQVEHPVTELIYGVDLVRQQLRIADGQPLSAAPQPLAPRGHAIECRITSEDTANAFLPSTGRVEYLRVPGGPGVRWDGGIEIGTEIGLYYDPLLAKLIVWAEDRARAIARMARALEELVIAGVATSQPFHRRVMTEPVFRSGQYHIGYLDEVGLELLNRERDPTDVELVALAAALAEHRRRCVPAEPPGPAGHDGASAWLKSARLGALRWSR